MTDKMKAAVLHEFNQPLKIEEVDTPTPGAGQNFGQDASVRRLSY